MNRLFDKIATLLDAIKFPHTIFALPFAIMSAFLAAGGLPTARQIFWILLCMVGARSAAMRGTEFSGTKDSRMENPVAELTKGVCPARCNSPANAELPPIRFGDEILGTIELEHHKRQTYGTRDLVTMATITPHVATAIHIAELRRPRARWAAGALLAVGAIVVFDLMHFSQGWVQFGYRFSNDFAPFALPLLAVGIDRLGGRRAWLVLGLVGCSILVNLWGVVWAIRLPRVLTAVVAGGALDPGAARNETRAVSPSRRK